MASMMAAFGCVILPLAARDRHCLLASSPASSFLRAAVPSDSRTRAAPSLRRSGRLHGFGSCFPVSRLSGKYASWSGAARASSRGGDSNRDDAGVVKDMERFLDDLSLEYDSVWDTKPAWCQPWTIVGTGVCVITLSWLPFNSYFLTGGVGLVIGLWWYYFLYVYPLGYSEMIAERRRLIENGSEDTYGRKRD